MTLEEIEQKLMEYFDKLVHELSPEDFSDVCRNLSDSFKFRAE